MDVYVLVLSSTRFAFNCFVFFYQWRESGGDREKKNDWMHWEEAEIAKKETETDARTLDSSEINASTRSLYQKENRLMMLDRNSIRMQRVCVKNYVVLLQVYGSMSAGKESKTRGDLHNQVGHLGTHGYSYKGESSERCAEVRLGMCADAFYPPVDDWFHYFHRKHWLVDYYRMVPRE